MREYQPFADERGRNWRQARIEVPLMLATLRVPHRVRVLEVGCGRGIALPPLARLLAPDRLVGIDIARSLLREAAANLGVQRTVAELVPADVRALPFEDASFDVVVDFGTCFHVARAGDALREIARVLVSRGLFVTETRLNQALSHPWRSRGRRLPWHDAPALVPFRRALLWQSRVRCAS